MPFWRKIYIALLENKKTPSRRLGIIKSPGDILRGHSYKYKCFCKGFYADTAGALSRFVCERVCKFLQTVWRGYGRGANIKRFFLSSKRIAAATKISPIPGPIWLLASKENKEQKAPITNTNIPAAAGNNAPNKLHKKFIFPVVFCWPKNADT